ncbi:hypothetical protein [Aquisalimonas sp.]|uniref:hypothetical protein n=1 Tax=Aquisalimonas sp. TaxID=1872621 RepID=UPI0025BF9A6F|nr:hypothetical protein [Aquisalimonas sp.]
MADQPTQPNKRAGSLARGKESAHQILLPGVKMDLAVVVLLLACLWFIVAVADLSRAGEVAALLGGSVLICGWLVWRTQAAMRRIRRSAGEAGDGQKQK